MIRTKRDLTSTASPEANVSQGVCPPPDLCAANKCCILINHQPGRFDVTTQRATCLEFAAFSHENIALHRPSHLHRFCPDLTAYVRVLPKRERSGGIDCALHLAVDEQLVQEFDRTFNRNSSGETSAGLRLYVRTGGWPVSDRWSGRFVCVARGFGLSSEDVHSVIPPRHREIYYRSSTISVQSRCHLGYDATTENGSSGNPKPSAVRWRHNEPGQLGRLPGKMRASERIDGNVSVVFMLTYKETGGRRSQIFCSIRYPITKAWDWVQGTA